jgi:hypothetical protein
MSKNTGIPYEILTQQIFQALHDQDQVKNIKVQHNVELQGKTLKHQIDVYWEYELGGVVYRAIVQAKDWGQAVTQNQLLAFKAILDDLPGQPRGIFVTRTGYQSGAEQFAKANGIVLYELRVPTEEDMKGKVMTIKLRTHAFAQHSSDVEPLFDQTWVVAEAQKLGLGPNENLPISASGLGDQLLLLDEAGQQVCTFHDVLKTMFPAEYVELPPTVKEHLFSSPTFMPTNNARFPRIKLRGIRAVIAVERQDQEMILNGEDFIGFIMHEVIGDKTRLIDKQNRPIK